MDVTGGGPRSKDPETTQEVKKYGVSAGSAGHPGVSCKLERSGAWRLLLGSLAASSEAAATETEERVSRSS